MAVREGEGKGRVEEGERRRERKGGREGRKGGGPLSMPLGAGPLAACFPELWSPHRFLQALPRSLSAPRIPAWGKCSRRSSLGQGYSRNGVSAQVYNPDVYFLAVHAQSLPLKNCLGVRVAASNRDGRGSSH